MGRDPANQIGTLSRTHAHVKPTVPVFIGIAALDDTTAPASERTTSRSLTPQRPGTR